MGVSGICSSAKLCFVHFGIIVIARSFSGVMLLLCYPSRMWITGLLFCAPAQNMLFAPDLISREIFCNTIFFLFCANCTSDPQRRSQQPKGEIVMPMKEEEDEPLLPPPPPQQQQPAPVPVPAPAAPVAAPVAAPAASAVPAPAAAPAEEADVLKLLAEEET